MFTAALVIGIIVLLMIVKAALWDLVGDWFEMQRVEQFGTIAVIAVFGACVVSYMILIFNIN